MLLEMAADGAPDRVVVGDVATGLTAVAIMELSRKAAARFRTSGAEYVAFLGLNSDAVPIALFGAAFAGIPFVPVSYRATDPQLREILSRVSPAVVVCEQAEAARLDDLGVECLITPAELLEPAAGDPVLGESALADP